MHKGICAHNDCVMPDLSVQASKLLLMSGLLHAVSLSQQLVNAPGLELTYVLPHACVQICAFVLVYRGVMIYMQHLGILGADWSKRASIKRYCSVIQWHSSLDPIQESLHFLSFILGSLEISVFVNDFCFLHQGFVANMMSLSATVLSTLVSSQGHQWFRGLNITYIYQR